MDRKLIFLDIDGTILAHGEEVHPAVLEGLRRARNKGHMVFISTGRSHGSVPPEILDMETDGLICSAGSVLSPAFLSNCCGQTVFQPPYVASFLLSDLTCVSFRSAAAAEVIQDH